MNEPIDTKWQYVARKCREQGNERAAAVADEMDELLATIPEYDRVTQDWADDLESGEVDDMDIIDVVQCSDYCTACARTETIGCGGCVFKNLGGSKLYYAICYMMKRGDD